MATTTTTTTTTTTRTTTTTTTTTTVGWRAGAHRRPRGARATAATAARARSHGGVGVTLGRATPTGATASSLVTRVRAICGSSDGAGGGGRGRGGGGDGGGGHGGHGNGNDDAGDDFFRRLRGVAATAVAMGTLHALSPSPAGAKAKMGKASTKREAKLQNLATSALYGFVFFYAIKLALKRLFAPLLLFTGTTQLLFNMGAVKISPMMIYDSFIKPYVPNEYQRSLNEFGDKAMNDSWWQKQERRFFTCAHRILPACDSPMGERALILGVLLAGLAG